MSIAKRIHDNEKGPTMKTNKDYQEGTNKSQENTPKCMTSTVIATQRTRARISAK